MTLAQTLKTFVQGRDGGIAPFTAASWGVGTFATTTMLNGVSVVLLYFLVNMVKIEPVIAGSLLFFSKIVDVITDPLMGVLSDRTRSRWGRRRPYLFGSSFFCGVSFALLYNVPESAGQSWALIFVTLCLVFYALAYTGFQIPYMAMPTEMTDDYHERTGIMSYRVVFMTLGNTMGASGVPYLVSVLGGDRAAYGQMGLIVGGIICGAMLVTFFGTAKARSTDRVPTTMPLKEQAWLIARNRPLVVLIGIKAVLYAGIAAKVSVLLFFIIAVLKRGPADVALYGVTQTAATLMFTPVCVWLSRQIGKRRAYVLSLLLHAVLIMSWLMASPEESTTAFVIRSFLLGIPSAGLFLYSNSMLVDTFAYDHKLSGLRREGTLAATFSFVEKLSLSLGPLVIGTLLTAMGFDKSLGPTADQPASAVQAMYIGFIWIPVGAHLIAASLLYFYKLDAADLDE